MFDEIDINGEKVKIFFDVENMRFYIDQNFEEELYKDGEKSKIIQINNNIICIDKDDKYIYSWNGAKYYNILYYFNFNTMEYIDGVQEINRIQYCSKVLDEFLFPHTKSQEIIEEIKIISLKVENMEIKTYINRKNYREKYLDTFKSFIECEFQSTNDWEKIYSLCKIIEDFIKISIYSKNIDRPTIKIFNSKNEEMGELFINQIFYKNVNVSIGEGKFEGVIERNCEKILKFLCKNGKLNLSNIREEKCYNRIFDTKSIYDLYSAFEIESSKRYKKKEIDTIHENIKKKIIKYSKEMEEYTDNKEFIDGLIKDRIENYGINYGHKERLRKAIEEYIDIIPERRDFYNLKTQMEDIIKIVYRLRTDIIHENIIEKLEDYENRYLEYFEWIVYAMQLKRMEINDEDIEKILNLTFGIG